MIRPDPKASMMSASILVISATTSSGVDVDSTWTYKLVSCSSRATVPGVKEIAVHVGYESASSFSNAFKRLIGKSPADFRKNGNAA